MSAYRDHRDGTWRYRKLITLTDGTKKRIKGTPAIDTKVAAEAAERAHIERMLHPERVLAEAAATRAALVEATGSKEPTIGKLIDLMIERYQEGSDNANHSRNLILKTDVRRYFGSMRPSEITQAHINAFRDELRKRPGKRKGTKLADQSIRNKLFALTRLLSWAVEEEIIAPLDRSLVVKVKASKAVREADDPEVLPVSDENVAKLIAAAWDPRYRAAIRLAAEAGLRVGEILAARWTDIQTKDGIKGILIQRSVSARNVESPPKGKMTRFVPLSSSTLKELERVPRRGFYIIAPLDSADSRSRNNPRVLGTHLTYSALNKAIKAVYRRAELSFGWSEEGTINPWHSLRHTYGTRLVADGVQGEYIQRLMGHKDYRTTQRYIRVTRAHLGAVVARVFG